jgi:hypothetical protein
MLKRDKQPAAFQYLGDVGGTSIAEAKVKFP